MACRQAGRNGYPTTDKGFTPGTFHEDKLYEPGRWITPQVVPVNFMGDMFHDAVKTEHLDRGFAVMAQYKLNTYLLLTKRVKRMADYFMDPDTIFRIQRLVQGSLAHRWPLPNVRFGASISNQPDADERIPQLLRLGDMPRRTVSPFLWVSVEPMLGPVDLTKWLRLNQVRGPEVPWPVGTIHGVENPPKRFAARFEPRLDWVTTGGESGPNARPSHPDWFRSLRDQCTAAGVAFHFKQWGEWGPCYGEPECTPRFGGMQDEIGGGVSWMERVGAKNAGRLLDGKVWDEMPQVGS